MLYWNWNNVKGQAEEARHPDAQNYLQFTVQPKPSSGDARKISIENFQYTVNAHTLHKMTFSKKATND